MPPDLKRSFQEAGVDSLRVLLSILQDEEARAADRIRAAEIILDRGYGRPGQSVELSGETSAAGVIIIPEVFAG